jgi:hypothetical protein
MKMKFALYLHHIDIPVLLQCSLSGQLQILHNPRHLCRQTHKTQKNLKRQEISFSHQKTMIGLQKSIQRVRALEESDNVDLLRFDSYGIGS